MNTMSSARFDEEWWWVFSYGITVVVVVVANILLLISVLRNAFLHTECKSMLLHFGLEECLKGGQFVGHLIFYQMEAFCR